MNRNNWLFTGLWVLTLLMASPTQAAEQKLTVLNPLGQPPAITKVPMAPRLDTLAGKTIYIVDIGFTDTHRLFTEMQSLLGVRYPDTKWEVRTKIGTYFEDDPKLWAEIKAQGHGMIIGVGH
ncbi:MAG: Thiol-disulfide oxidoreductase protein [Gammaproteobacteria bacterium]|nr:Thiol-disulfide oxidoreductase protein [Gammaproteobacteria bacterium]